MTDDSPNTSERDGTDAVDREELVSRAVDDPEAITPEEMSRIVALVNADDVDERLRGAEALQNLYDRPDLFEPHVSTLLQTGAHYPDDVDGIPSPQQVMASDELRATVYVADSLARVAQARPSVFEPHLDWLEDAVFGDESVPAYYAFIAGYVYGHTNAVPEERLVAELCSYLDRGRGNGYPSWAADALRVLGDDSALPALEAKYPDEPLDDATTDAFDAAIEALEN
ncbi:hypothetical protein [Haloplanus salilacus]|uniref:hypothetical protein n=1 Tax=Haloplanus salilacus TaxID=2949994 RepID=UPI0030CC85DE